MEKKYKIIDDFLCGGQKMVIIGMSGDTCIMPKKTIIVLLLLRENIRRE